MVAAIRFLSFHCLASHFSLPSSPSRPRFPAARRWTMEARIAAWDAILGARRVRRLHKTSVSLPSTPKTSISSLFAKEDAAAAARLAALEKKSEVEAATKAAAALLSLKHQLEREREARRERYQNAAAAAALPPRRIGLLIGDAHVRTLRQVRGVAPRVATEPRCVLPPILVHVLSPDALRVKRETYLRRLRREDTVRRLAYAPTQAESAPLAFKLSTSRRTNMSLLTFDF